MMRATYDCPVRLPPNMRAMIFAIYDARGLWLSDSLSPKYAIYDAREL